MKLKRCGRCNTNKPLTDFHKSSAKGMQSYCKDCNRQQKREWYERDPENRKRVRWNVLWTKYRLRKDDYERMISDQEGRCPVCGVIFDDDEVVDHNHSTGKVRGLLCQRCNHLVGWVEKHGKLIRKCESYLERSR